MFEKAVEKDRRIRVMRIIARMNVGGPAVQVSGLMRGFNSEQFDQRLLTGFCNPDEADYLDTVATDVVATKIKGFGRSISPKEDLVSFFRIAREIRKFKPDIIHTHTAKAGFVGRAASLLSGHRSLRVHTFHGHLLHGYFSPLKTKLVIWAEKVLAIFTNFLLAVGETVKNDLLEAGIGNPKKFGVMPPGLQLETLPSKEAARKVLGLSDSAIYCAFIGRITQIKRPDRLLDVVAELTRQGSPVRFIVAGAGDLLDESQTRAEKENLPVTFLGWRSDIETVLAASDIVLLTSDNEGTPLSLIQAGMAGAPVVSTNVGSVSEVVQNNVGGFVVDTSVDSLARAISRLVADSDLRKKMGDAAKEYTTSRYGVKRLVEDHQNLYKKLLNDRAKS
ncbi:MAG: glycosyltransferase [Actinomycetota bacterium]